MLPLKIFDCKYDNENFNKNKKRILFAKVTFSLRRYIVVVVAKIDNKGQMLFQMSQHSDNVPKFLHDFEIHLIQKTLKQQQFIFIRNSQRISCM